MVPRGQLLISAVAALLLAATAFIVITDSGLFSSYAPQGNTASVVTLTPISIKDPSGESATSTHATPTKSSTTTKQPVKNTNPGAPKGQPQPKEDEVTRIENPYPFPPDSFSTVNERTRAALVNIFCSTRGGMRPVSGSGVIIDPRGVILTNAHVAQYLLLSKSSEVDLSCVIRSGSPARTRWSAEVLYLPPVWVQENAANITTSGPTGTGEHDYALLRITGPVGASGSGPIPFIPYDPREAIGFVRDMVLVASYPAEFLGGITTHFDLFSASSVTTIKELLTFATKTVDVVSTGGVIEAQSGSSGGAIVNGWSRLIGIITTRSEGATTADRNLHSLTLSYINRDLRAQTGSDLQIFLSKDVVAEAEDFNQIIAPGLIETLINKIRERSN